MDAWGSQPEASLSLSNLHINQPQPPSTHGQWWIYDILLFCKNSESGSRTFINLKQHNHTYSTLPIPRIGMWSPFRNRGSQYWRIVYPANFYAEGHPRIRSILLINTNLSTDCYSILPISHSDIMAVRFKGANGYLSIFNIYNEITNNDTLQCLDHFIDHNSQLIRPSISDCVIWLGDFNHRHLIWEDKANERLFKPEDYISPLINLLYKNNMVLALPKGTPTFQTLARNWTWPDNVWRCNTFDNPIIHCEVILAIHPPLADHMPVITILDLLFTRSSAPQLLNFRSGDWPTINNTLRQHHTPDYKTLNRWWSGKTSGKATLWISRNHSGWVLSTHLLLLIPNCWVLLPLHHPVT